jgi:hypothetical protein
MRDKGLILSMRVVIAFAVLMSRLDTHIPAKEFSLVGEP